MVKHLVPESVPIRWDHGYSQTPVQSVYRVRAQELCGCRGGPPGLPVPNKPGGFCGRKATLKQNCTESELRSCVKIEGAVLGSLSLIVHKVYMDVKQHLT